MERVSLLDCTGKVTHTLTLLLDGRVEIQFSSGRRAVIDPGQQHCFTPGVNIPADLYEAARGLRPG